MMRRLSPWTLVVVAVVGLLATLLIVFVAVAQGPPAAAPVAPAEAAPEDANVPPVPGDARGEARERMERLRGMWARGGMTGGGQPVMTVAGDHVYLLYGGYLCQFSVNGLALEAKVDLREALGLEEQWRDLIRRERGRRAAPAAPAPAEGEAQPQ